MKHREAKFNVATQTGTFSDKAHHGEMRRNAKLNNDAPTSQGQSLAGDKGIAGARMIMASRHKKA